MSSSPRGGVAWQSDSFLYDDWIFDLSYFGLWDTPFIVVDLGILTYEAR